jgi:hypothetical protein
MRITSSGAQLFEGGGTLYDMKRGSILHGIDLFCFFFLLAAGVSLEIPSQTIQTCDLKFTSIMHQIL